MNEKKETELRDHINEVLRGARPQSIEEIEELEKEAERIDERLTGERGARKWVFQRRDEIKFGPQECPTIQWCMGPEEKKNDTEKD